MKIKKDLHGDNSEYRAARGTLRPFKLNLKAWAKLRAEHIAAKAAKRKREEVPQEPRPATAPSKGGRLKGSKNKKATEKKGRK